MQAGNSQSWKARDKLGPRDGILYQTVSRLPVVNQIFLGSWMVDILQEGRSRHQLPKGETWPTWESVPTAHSGNWAAGPRRWWDVPHWAARTWEGHKTPAQPLWSTQEPEPEQHRRGKYTQPRARLRQYPCRAICSLSSVDQESTHTVSGANPVWLRHFKRSPHTPVTLVCSATPSPQHDWTSEPK